MVELLIFANVIPNTFDIFSNYTDYVLRYYHVAHSGSESCGELSTLKNIFGRIELRMEIVEFFIRFSIHEAIYAPHFQKGRKRVAEAI